MQRLNHFTVAGLVAAAALSAAPAARTPPPVEPYQSPVPARQPAEGTAELTVFIRGTMVGVEQVHVSRSGGTFIISSSARFGPPLNVVVNRFELKYTADWQPVDMLIEATQGAKTLGLATSFGVTTAINEIKQNGVINTKTDQISARTVVLPNNIYAPFEALAARLASAAVGTDLPAYIAPDAEIRVAVRAIAEEQIQTPGGPVATKRFDLTFQNPGGALEAIVAIDGRGRLVRLEIPGAGVRVIRSDLAGVATRSQPVRNKTDVDVLIPAAGFNLAGTMTIPPGMGRLRHPAIVLVGGSGPVERDETVAGVPIFAQLAGALAEQGFVVLRYDKRGVAQSGGRSERATLQDYAEDLITALKWLAKREQIDPKRIAVAGHSEGGAVALLAAAREKRIAALVLMAAPGTRGAELILEQQRHMLDVMKAPEAERRAKIEMQQKIQAAVTTEKGWEGLPPELRKQADTPWFRSLLLFDPARAMSKVKQPILIIQGNLDTQVPAHHGDSLASLARARKKSGPVELLHLPGINHLLTPAVTGEVSEYPALKEKTITPAVAKAIAEWLRK